jgi:hypothetical protein
VQRSPASVVKRSPAVVVQRSPAVVVQRSPDRCTLATEGLPAFSKRRPFRSAKWHGRETVPQPMDRLVDSPGRALFPPACLAVLPQILARWTFFAIFREDSSNTYVAWAV